MIMFMLLTTILILTSTSMFMAITPLTMGMSILTMALTLAIMYSWLMSSWIAFLIFLIYVSGMLVMFAYFVALSPNQKTNMSTIMLPLIMISIMVISSMKTMNLTLYTSSFLKTSMNMFYLKNNILLLILLALILLITMIVVVKLVTSSKGPLRPFINYV